MIKKIKFLVIIDSDYLEDLFSMIKIFLNLILNTSNIEKLIYDYQVI